MWVVGAGFVGVEFNKIQSVSNSNTVEKCGKVAMSHTGTIVDFIFGSRVHLNSTHQIEKKNNEEKPDLESPGTMGP